MINQEGVTKDEALVVWEIPRDRPGAISIYPYNRVGGTAIFGEPRIADERASDGAMGDIHATYRAAWSIGGDQEPFGLAIQRATRPVGLMAAPLRTLLAMDEDRRFHIIPAPP